MTRRIGVFLSSDAGRIAILAASILLLTLGGLKLAQIVSWRMLREDALAASESWADSLGCTVEDLPAIVGGARPADASRHSLDIASRIGDTYRYRIWSANGDLVYSSERMPSASASRSLARRIGSEAAASILSGKESSRMQAGTGPENTDYFAVSFIPIVRDGKVIGAFEIYLDQTADKSLYEHSFFLTESILAIAILLAGGFPVFLVYRKMLDHRAAKAEALYLAEHDNLTGAPNRRNLEQRVAGALSLARRNDQSVAALLLDIDRFKEINDNYGHQAGDAVLRAFTQRLKAACRAGDIVARLGGDEFVLLQIGSPQPHGAATLAERLTKALSEPYSVDGIELICGASVGVAVFPQDADDWDALLSCADAAMYKSKSSGRNTVSFFQPGMDAILRERRQTEVDIRRALNEGLFRLAFQPLLNCKDNRLAGFEALLRWPMGWPPKSPDKFVPVAEEAGLMVPLGAWVLEAACRAAAAWPRPLKIAVNLSPMQFYQGDVVAMVEHALQVSGLEPSRLELEVTESLWLQNSDAVLGQLARLRSIGVSIALDDFGTGFSSLTYLWRFPFDKVKIDRSFVSEMQAEPKAAAIVYSVVALAKTLQLTVTAEGVETRAQARALLEAGCDQAQGYLFSRPLPADGAEALIEAELLSCTTFDPSPGSEPPSRALVPVSRRPRSVAVEETTGSEGALLADRFAGAAL